jgi:hypothetical protein
MPKKIPSAQAGSAHVQKMQGFVLAQVYDESQVAYLDYLGFRDYLLKI